MTAAHISARFSLRYHFFFLLPLSLGLSLPSSFASPTLPPPPPLVTLRARPCNATRLRRILPRAPLHQRGGGNSRARTAGAPRTRHWPTTLDLASSLLSLTYTRRRRGRSCIQRIYTSGRSPPPRSLSRRATFYPSLPPSPPLSLSPTLSRRVLAPPLPPSFQPFDSPSLPRCLSSKCSPRRHSSFRFLFAFVLSISLSPSYFPSLFCD